MKVCCALAIAAGTYVGGWRVIRTLGKGLVEIAPPQGMAAEASSAAIILSSSHLGMALSTTHVATGSILGTGLGRKGARRALGGRRPHDRRLADHLARRRARSERCAGSWPTPSAARSGVGVVFAILVAASAGMYLKSRRTAITPDNVNADWEGGRSAPAPDQTPDKTPAGV